MAKVYGMNEMSLEFIYINFAKNMNQLFVIALLSVLQIIGNYRQYVEAFLENFFNAITIFFQIFNRGRRMMEDRINSSTRRLNFEN